MFTGPNIVTDGLILHLDAANVKSYPETGTAWNDLSGNNNHGELVNGPTYDSANGGSIVFDGIGDFFTFPDLVFTDEPYTIEIYGKLTGPINTDNRRSIFCDGSGVGEFSNPFTFFTTAYIDGIRTFSNLNFSTAGSIVVDQVFHWVFTMDETGLVMMYFNGKPINSPLTGLTGGTTITTLYRRFGTRSGDSRPYNGNLYYSRFYNKVLTNGEVLQNYNATKSRFGL